MKSRRQDEFDRDFTAMVSGLEMEGFRVDSPAAEDPPDLRSGSPGSRRGHDPLDDRPEDPFDEFNMEAALDETEPDDPDPSEYTPPPLPPMRAPSGLGLVGWACATYVLATVILTIIGVDLPRWAGWLAIGAFVAALVIGWRSLPRDRDPDSGDGAVV